MKFNDPTISNLFQFKWIQIQSEKKLLILKVDAVRSSMKWINSNLILPKFWYLKLELNIIQ